MNSRSDIFSNEELVQQLADFGLSFNQIKVYLSICLLKTASATEIAKETRIYRQDIYKILPILEKKGLIVRIIGSPMRYEALPVGKAIDSLILVERNIAEERFARLAANLKNVKKQVSKLQNGIHTKQRDEPLKFLLLTTNAEIKNKFDLSFEKIEEEFCVVTTPTLAPNIISKIRARIKTLAKKGLKTRLIVENPLNNFAKETSLVEKLVPKNTEFFVAKRFSDGFLLPYRLFDDKEVWVMVSKPSETGSPSFLWTNSKNIVKFYKNSFEKAWNNPNAKEIGVARERSEAHAQRALTE